MVTVLTVCLLQVRFIIEHGSCGLSDCPVLPVLFSAQSQDRYRVSKPLAMPVQLLVPVEAAVNYTGKLRASVPSIWLTAIIIVFSFIFFKRLDFLNLAF